MACRVEVRTSLKRRSASSSIRTLVLHGASRIGSMTLCLLGLFVCVASSTRVNADTDTGRVVDFARDVKPLLADRCFACHGPDAETREADLRLDVSTDSLQNVISPGDAGDSELLSRVTSVDDDQRMPPVGSNKMPLNEEEVSVIRSWIRQGARYSNHWAYEPPVRPVVPTVESESSPVDAFITRRLREAGTHSSDAADARTLARRLAFDLTGLPPSAEMVEELMADPSDAGLEQLVDELLESSAFGERMATLWLDLVRYADTNGIHGDNHRDHASYRDYVIKAFNDGMPFDQFVVEQVAGDLIPEATYQQRIASGFNRLNMTTREGGAQAKEYLAIYAADRVRNTGTIFLGSTIGCAQCHDHKFDPFTSKDFYRFAAYFADIEETPVGVQKATTLPRIILNGDKVASKADLLVKQISQLRNTLSTQTPELDGALREWIADSADALSKAPVLAHWHRLGPFSAENFSTAHDESFIDEREAPVDIKNTYTERRLKWKLAKELSDGKTHSFSGENSATYLARSIDTRHPRPLEISLGSDDSIKVWLNGDLVHEERVQRGVKPDQSKIKLKLRAGKNWLLMKISNGKGGSGFYFRPILHDLPTNVHRLLVSETEEHTPKELEELARFHRTIAPELAAERKQLHDLETAYATLTGGELPVLVTQRVKPRMMRVLPRGNWLDDSGEVVLPGTPAFLGAILQPANQRQTRMDLARWLVHRDNPLVSRVYVNRLWKVAFGYGLVRTLDDFGSQGSLPSHPALLDWLASEFMESGWSTKHILKMLVMSRTYRQASHTRKDLRQLDPANRLLARQNRFRLDAEFVRDNALSVSGLLVRKVGGPSVKPYQPVGYWAHLNFPQRKYQADSGDSQYRRGLYTYWCRTFLHPSLLAFDAPSREECTVERPRSNTPQAALALLNDPTYVEAARKFAERVLREGGSSSSARMRFAFRTALHRNPDARETDLLEHLLAKHLEQYRNDPDAARATQTVGQAPYDLEVDLAELGRMDVGLQNHSELT